MRRLAPLALLLGLGCASPSQLVVVVDTNLEVPEELDLVEVVITGPDGVRTTTPQSLVEAGAPELPLTLGVAPDDGSLGPITVAAVGRLDGVEVVRRTAEVTLVAGETRVLHLVLYRSCAGRQCPEGESCDASGCVAEAVEDLPAWTGELPTFDDSDPCLRMAWDEDGDGDGIALCGGTDCDDAEPLAFGGAAEACDVVDNDCDDTVDEGCSCAPVGAVEDCPTACGSVGDRRCEEGGWGACTLREEACNAADDDCDGATDEGFVYEASAPVAITTTAAASLEPDIVWTGDRYGLTWVDSTDAAGIHFVQLDASGAPMGAPARIASNGRTPAITWTGSHYGLTWTERQSTSGCCDSTCASTCTTYYDRIDLLALDASGAPVGAITEVNPDADTNPRPRIVWNGSAFVVGYAHAGSYLEQRMLDGTQIGMRERAGSRYGPFDLVFTGARYALTLESADDWYFTQGVLGMFPAETSIATFERTGSPSLAWTGDGFITAIGTSGRRGDELPTVQVMAIDAEGLQRSALPTVLTASRGDGSGGFLGDDPLPPGIDAGTAQVLVTWEDGRDGNANIYFARIAPDGTVLQPATPVAMTPDASTHSHPAFAGDGFGIVWSEDTTTGSEEIVFARVACPP